MNAAYLDSVVRDIVDQPFHTVKHSEYGTIMRMLDEEVPFTISLASSTAESKGLTNLRQSERRFRAMNILFEILIKIRPRQGAQQNQVKQTPCEEEAIRRMQNTVFPAVIKRSQGADFVNCICEMPSAPRTVRFLLIYGRLFWYHTCSARLCMSSMISLLLPALAYMQPSCPAAQCLQHAAQSDRTPEVRLDNQLQCCCTRDKEGVLLSLQGTPAYCNQMLLASAVAQYAGAWSRDHFAVAATDVNSVLSRPILQAMKVVHITCGLPKICL